MSTTLQRIREHMVLETRALLLQAERARLFDNNTNRGSEAEHSIRRWLSARFAPTYLVSSGEIIDTFDTERDLPSRQQDGILHSNDADANRFLLPSGMRLVPIETVAAVVEVKLTLSKAEFDSAERAANETLRLRFRADRERSRLPVRDGERFGKNVGGVYQPDRKMEEEHFTSGVSQLEARFKHPPTTFALFAFGGGQQLDTIRGWMEGARISVVCCLDAGCIVRDHDGDGTVTSESSADESLWHFSEALVQAIEHHAWAMRIFQPDFSAYAPYSKQLVVG